MLVQCVCVCAKIVEVCYFFIFFLDLTFLRSAPHIKHLKVLQYVYFEPWYRASHRILGRDWGISADKIQKMMVTHKTMCKCFARFAGFLPVRKIHDKGRVFDGGRSRCYTPLRLRIFLSSTLSNTRIIQKASEHFSSPVTRLIDDYSAIWWLHLKQGRECDWCATLCDVSWIVGTKFQKGVFIDCDRMQQHGKSMKNFHHIFNTIAI